MTGMATDQPRIGDQIRRARQRKRWTQRQLADRVHVDRKTVDNWENDRSYPRSSIGALEDVLGATFDSDSAQPRSATREEMLEAVASVEETVRWLRAQIDGNTNGHDHDKAS